MAEKRFTNTGLVAHCQKALSDKTMYMWGGIYRPITENYIAALAKMYPKQYTAERKAQLMSAVGKAYSGIDCVGIIKSYYWGGKGSKYYNAATDVNATGMFEHAKLKGTIAKLPEQAGLILYCKSNVHVGVYIGNGEVIESTLSRRGDGVVKTRLSDFAWEYWCQCPYITADNVPPEAYRVTAEKDVTASELAKTMQLLGANGFKAKADKIS